MSMHRFRGCTEWALMVALVFGAGAMAQAQEDAGETASAEADAEARVIQIGPADDAAESTPGSNESSDEIAASQYWIGLLGGPVTEELLHHIALPEGQGLLVREVVPDSPAEKAGLQKWDIMLRANDAELTDMRDLVDLVATAGPQESAIAIEVMRHGSRETIHVTPETRPEQVAMPGAGFGGEMGGFPGLQPGQDPRELLQMFQRGMGPNGEMLEFRNLGPGAFGGGAGLEGIPNGVSISVHKEGDKPARVTVKRGDESWEVVADDPESLEKLPEDLRPFVNQMLHGGGQMPAIDMPMIAPGQGFDGPQDFNKRLEEMERRMKDIQERLLNRNGQAEEDR